MAPRLLAMTGDPAALRWSHDAVTSEGDAVVLWHEPALAGLTARARARPPYAPAQPTCLARGQSCDRRAPRLRATRGHQQRASLARRSRVAGAPPRASADRRARRRQTHSACPAQNGGAAAPETHRRAMHAGRL
ncbi:MAG: hypothetical protein NVSMB65_21020 [Chloroflexota bacterium]